MLKPTSDTGLIAAITVASRHRGSTSKPTSQRGASVRYCRAPHVSVALDLQNHVEPLPLGSQVFRPGSPTSLTSQSASQHPRDLRLRAGGGCQAFWRSNAGVRHETLDYAVVSSIREDQRSDPHIAILRA